MKWKWFALTLSLVTGQAHGEFVSVCERSPDVKNFLVRELNTPCQLITEQGLASIKGSEYFPTKILSIHNLLPGDFSGLSNLRSLEIRFLRTPRLKFGEGVFDGLERLEELTLMGVAEDDSTPIFSENMFRGLNSLRSLVLRRFAIHRIPSRFLSSAKRIERVIFLKTA